MPVEIVARQPRQLEAHHDADLAARNRSDHVAEATARTGQRGALALIFVEHDDPCSRVQPSATACSAKPYCKRALEVVAHLARRRLSDVDEREPLLVLASDLHEINGRRHRSSSLLPCVLDGPRAALATS